MTATEFATAIATGQPSPDALNWLQAGFQRYMTGQAPSLEIGLGLTGARRVAARNAILLRAAELIDSGELGAWALSGHLAAAIERFESRVLPQIRKGLAGELSAVDTQLLRAWQTGAKPLRSRRRLFDLLTNT